jgi:hypothetical protein
MNLIDLSKDASKAVFKALIEANGILNPECRVLYVSTILRNSNLSYIVNNIDFSGSSISFVTCLNAQLIRAKNDKNVEDIKNFLVTLLTKLLVKENSLLLDFQSQNVIDNITTALNLLSQE